MSEYSTNPQEEQLPENGLHLPEQEQQNESVESDLSSELSSDQSSGIVSDFLPDSEQHLFVASSEPESAVIAEATENEFTTPESQEEEAQEAPAVVADGITFESSVEEQVPVSTDSTEQASAEDSGIHFQINESTTDFLQQPETGSLENAVEFLEKDQVVELTDDSALNAEALEANDQTSGIEELIQVEDAELEAMETEESEASPEDYSGLDKEQLVKLAEQLNRDPDPILASRVIQKIKPLFDGLFQKEKQEALGKYTEEGGNPDTFEFRFQPLEQRFHQALKGISEKRRLSQETQIRERARNLEQKLGLLEQLRLLVDDHEHTPGYEKFKAIREEWKKIGPVGPEHAQNLNASYFSLIDRFHSLSEIYHNLRDFDRKKNLELKLDIISRIEKLAEEPLISKAMKELIILQEEYRTAGPVPNDRFEEIKTRFKAAADVLFERRRAFNEERKVLLQEEVSLKNALLEKIAGFDQFVGSTAKEWQEKTKELLALQDEWKASPGRFREKTAEQGKQFWAIFKKYMANKNEFFKNLDKSRKDILASKQTLVDEVNSLKDGEDWDGIVNRMKELQAEWKRIAPVFGKDGQKLYDDFKSGIDHFFNRLRDRRSGEDKIHTENLLAKDNLCEEIEKEAVSGKGDKRMVDAFREKFRSIGHVPSKQIQRINGRFSKALMSLIDASTLIETNEKERMKIQILSSRSTYSSEGVKQLRDQESYIQKRLQQLRKDAGNLEDNVAMFRMSKNAMAMIEDVQKRINLYHMEIKELEAQLREIRNTEKAES